MINLTSLSYFVEVATELNITKTAHKKHISQQALSFHIQKVEEYYGVSLFDRKPILHLTYAGEVCLQHAKSILKDCEALTNQMAAISGRCSGRLRIGISPHPAQLVLPQIIPEFRHRWPNITLEFPQLTMASRVNCILDRELDIGIGIYNKNDPHISTEFLFDDHLYVLIPEKLLRDEFGENYQAVTQKEKKGTDLIAFRSFPFMLLSSSSHLGKAVNDYFEKNNIKPNVIINTESLDILESLLSCEVAAMICGRLRAAEILKRSPGLNAFPLLITPKHMTHCFQLLTLCDANLPEYGQDFISLTRCAFRSLDSGLLP